jgi:DDE superfamily endonuclease
MADAGYGHHAAFRAGPTERGSPGVRQVEGDLTALSGDAVPELWPYAGRRPRGQPRHRSRPVGLRQHALAGGRDATVEPTWRASGQTASASAAAPSAGARTGTAGRLSGSRPGRRSVNRPPSPSLQRRTGVPTAARSRAR